MKHIVLIFAFTTFLHTSCKNEKNKADTTETSSSEVVSKPREVQSAISIIPILHASAIIEGAGKTIYIDPTGGAKPYNNQKKADIVLITDIHGDHMNIETLDSLDLSGSKIVAPEAVAERLPAGYTANLKVLSNGNKIEIGGIVIEAIPMYNLREEALKFHQKGRGNGYVINLAGERLYFSGDTEDIPEMRALTNIDKAFVCMNLPYTMTVESAADAVLEFKPKQIYPYHYRGTEGFSDVKKFKNIITSKNPEITVVQLDWYPTTN